MGNRHGAESFTSTRINPLEYPGLHWTLVDGQPEYTPSVGESLVLKYGRASILQTGFNGFEISGFKVARIHIVNLAPRINTIPAPEFLTDVQAKMVVEERMPYIHAITELANANVIVARHGRIWGLFPERFLAEEFVERGFDVPMVFPKVGGRNRIQEHAVLLLNR